MPSETTVNINLTPDLYRYVKARAAGGGYAGVSEFVREALREKRLREQRDGIVLTGAEEAEHRRLVQEGIASVEQGDFVEVDEAGLREFMAGVSARGKRRLAAEKNKPPR